MRHAFQTHAPHIKLQCLSGLMHSTEEEDLLKVGRGLGSADSASSASSECVMLRRFLGPPFLLGAPAPLLPVSAVRASAATAAALAAAAAASSYCRQTDSSYMRQRPVKKGLQKELAQL